MKSVYGEGLNSAQLKLLLLHIFTRISFHVFHTFVHFVFFLSLFLFLHALCDLLLCFVFVHGSSPNYLLTVHHHKLEKNYALQNLLNIISRAKMHTNTHTFAFVHHKKNHTGRTTCNSCWTARRASGRAAAAQQPTSPTLVDYLIGIVLQRPANAAAAIAKRRAIAMYQLR